LPFKDVEQEDIDTVVGAIEHAYGWNVLVMERHDLPQSAWYKAKNRYRAEILLDWLNTKIPDGADRIMGLTRKDISTTKGEIYDWGICGLAEAPGTAAMVSTYRIKKKMGKLSAVERKARYIQRLEDLSTHEFGHTLGLPHCPKTGCVMEDAKGTVTTFDHSSGELCDGCVEKLANWGYTLPPG
jgi:archaemetzincin